MYKQGDIWLVDFDPSIGREYQKVRPVLVIGNDSYLPLGSLITIIPVSSQVDKAILLDVLIPKDSGNRLTKDSLIKTRQICTFDKRRFIKFIGKCQSGFMRSVMDNVALYLIY